MYMPFIVLFNGFQYQLRRASLTEHDAYAFLKADSDGDYITYTGFCEALRQVLGILKTVHNLGVHVGNFSFWY